MCSTFHSSVPHLFVFLSGKERKAKKMNLKTIFFAILALPLAFIFGKHNGQTICLIFGLVISLLYWTLMILGQLFSVRIGLNPVILMWFPDFLVGGIGLVLYIALRRK